MFEMSMSSVYKLRKNIKIFNTYNWDGLYCATCACVVYKFKFICVKKIF